MDPELLMMLSLKRVINKFLKFFFSDGMHKKDRLNLISAKKEMDFLYHDR